MTQVDSKLMKAMGIDASQLSKKVATSKTKKPSTKLEVLKHEAKTSIALVNETQGKNVRFQALVRDGKTKDGKPQYKLTNQSGHYLITKNDDGTFTASRVHYYTESFTIADFMEIGSNSDLKK